MLLNEYDSLRSELVSMEATQRSIWIYMYVLFVSIFILGIEFSSNLFLVTYIVLIPFQVVINRYKLSIRRLSIYIKIFYEEDISEFNWETFQVYPEYLKYHKKISSTILGKIRDTAVIQLGILSALSYIVSVLSARFSNHTFTLYAEDIFFMVLCIILVIIIWVINKEYKRNNDDELEKVIRSYKDSLHFPS